MTFGKIIGLLLTTMLIENPLFARLLLPTDLSGKSMEKRALFSRSIISALVAVVAAPVGYFGRWISRLIPLDIPFLAAPIGIITYLTIMAIIWAIIPVFIKKLPMTRKEYNELPMGAVSFLPMGTLLVVAFGTETILESVIFGVATAAGYVLAIQLLAVLDRRTKDVKFPYLLRGLPSKLLCLGLLTMALYGLLGHSIIT